ncbi:MULTISPECIES: PilX N-terminal domain-containing pilus assembly protein [unclassified Pseudomonas]|uniref:pilus assembly PilX family protein n=1 Tax=unclassified Pseudomonas TaxID=196821 RepID=UPI002AC9067E|nr:MULTISPECIES: PilX N-terminal domain-containing pilus assembly protein [unclassified Pseudomonas]MEB0042450.1 PilX N-terminal domain-containing pilus assembly protein [Pseudomonas sp. MH10]MEB0076779.1 PilX N-terminal domain-containing pilus assembly protein [Pseudomonas sp. MH10out]MEB0090975.1 PilX N-terminal domain-containing pilus assembly protein [Pseudomonas sp. CCI4.2]MEB0101912.1 PilX N-terminal domain-containing pilus assembly protein [Pseudomonas sp. CCI3.2]MEB0121870.1 PilX N-ter
MNVSLRSTHFPMARQQAGITLVVAIIFLLIITVLAISSMRGVSLESRITANLKQQKTLRSAAEAGLRMGELSIGTTVAPTSVKTCTTTTCLPWVQSELTATSSVDTPSQFVAANATNMATAATAYNTKIQWYVVQLGMLDGKSQNSCAIKGCGAWYYEVNACASTVLCTSDTTTQRVILRTVIARYYP